MLLQDCDPAAVRQPLRETVPVGNTAPCKTAGVEVERRLRRAYLLRRAMQLWGIKAPAVAEGIHRDANTVRRWVNGSTAPSADDLLALADYFGLTLNDLIDPPPVPVYSLDQALLAGAARRGMREGLARLRTEGQESEASDPPRRLRQQRGREGLE